MRLQEDSSARVRMDLVQNSNFSVTLTQGVFAKNLQPLGTSPQLRAARQKLLPPEDAKLRQCKSGELRWLATVSRPDICARMARIASRTIALQSGNVYRINDVVKTAKKWQPAAVLKYVSSGNLGQENLALRGEDVRSRTENIHGNTMALVGWSDAAYEHQSGLRKCRLGYVIGLMLSNVCAPCHIIHVGVHTEAGKN